MEPKRPPLRIGLLADEPSVPRWLFGALECAVREGLAEIVLLVRPRPTERHGASKLRLLLHERSYLLYELFAALERIRHRAEDSGASVPIGSLAPDCVLMDVEPIEERFANELREEDVARIREMRLDVLLEVGFNLQRGEILNAARHGVFLLHHGDPHAHPMVPPGLWEVLESTPTSRIVLQRLAEEPDEGDILARAVLPTVPYSPRRNRAQLENNSARLLLPVLRRLWRGEPAKIGEALLDSAWRGSDRAPSRRPRNAELLRTLPRLAASYVWKRLTQFGTTDQWYLAWHWSLANRARVPYGGLPEYRRLLPPDGCFWADPFAVEDAGRHWLFFEERRLDRPNATICAVEMTEGGPAGTPREVLAEPWHLSFPCVFKHDGRWWMLPEGGRSRSVTLYEAVEFPWRWRRADSLLDKSLADPVLVEHEGLWYLFGSPYEDGELPSLELHIFVSNRMTGPFEPHRMNPVCTDASHARMAGAFFKVGDDLIRPAQVCVPTYGAAISMRRVTELSPTRYHEVGVQTLNPAWLREARGMHCINSSGRLSVIDLLRRRR